MPHVVATPRGWRRRIALDDPRTTTDGRWTMHTFTVQLPSRPTPLTGVVATSTVLGEVVVNIETTPDESGAVVPAHRTSMRDAGRSVLELLWGRRGSMAVSWDYAHCDRLSSDDERGVTYRAWGRVRD